MTLPPTSHADTYAVRLTAAGTGAIAVILLAGPAAHAIIMKLSPSPRVTTLVVSQFTRANLLWNGELLDDALILRTAPHRFELHLHGGIAVVDAVLSALQSAGAVTISLQRAAELGVLGSRIDADMQLAMPSATTATALKLLLAQPKAFAAFSSYWSQRLVEYPGDVWQFHSAVQWVLRRSQTLRRLFVPPRIAIVGPPNAGKSTLANALLGRAVSITSSTPGTTRDWVDARAIFASSGTQVAVTLIDTAGIRETADHLELQSIERTHSQAASADLVLVLFDATREPSGAELELMRAFQNRPALVVANKVDACAGRLPSHLAALDAISISAKAKLGLDTLMHAALVQLDLARVQSAEAFAFSGRIQAMLESLATCDDADACRQLLAELVR